MALSFFKDPDSMTPEFEKLGYCSTADFVELRKFYGLDENAVRGILGECKIRRPESEPMVRGSLLSEEAKKEYLRISADRLAVVPVRQGGRS